MAIVPYIYMHRNFKTLGVPTKCLVALYVVTPHIYFSIHLIQINYHVVHRDACDVQISLLVILLTVEMMAVRMVLMKVVLKYLGSRYLTKDIL